MAMMDLMLGQTAVFLVSPWKPVLLLVPLLAWAWFLARVAQPHADKYLIDNSKWNMVHMGAGLLALAAGLLIPLRGEVAFYLGFVVMVAILVADVMVYVSAINKDKRVPEHGRLEMSALSRAMAARKAAKGKKGEGKVTLTFRMPDKSALTPPLAETPEYQTRVMAEDLFLKPMAARASQVDLAPVSKEAYQISTLVDGIKVTGEQVPAAAAIRMIDFWKTTASLDVNERRKRLMGDATVESAAGKNKVRVTAAGVPGGMKMSLVFDPDKAVKRKAAELGLLPEQFVEMEILTGRKVKLDDEAGTPVTDSERKGVVVLAAPPDTGRTTSFYTFAAMHDAYTSSVQTLEVEQQLAIEGVKATIFDPTVEGADFATTTRSILRRDPHVLFIAELPDANTAKEISKADLEMTRIYVSLNAQSALEAIEKYVRAVGDPAVAAKGLRGVVCQRLIRKLCTNCKVDYPPTPDMLKKMGVGANVKVEKLSKKGGQVMVKNKPETCPVCGGSGYVGQEGVFEVYRLNDECREAVAQQNWPGLKAAFKKMNLPGIQQAAIRKALEAKTSVEEVMRVTAAPAAPAAAAPAAGAKPAAPPKA